MITLLRRRFSSVSTFQIGHDLPALYNSLISSQHWVYDASQESLMLRLHRLSMKLKGYEPSQYKEAVRRAAARRWEVYSSDTQGNQVVVKDFSSKVEAENCATKEHEENHNLGHFVREVTLSEYDFQKQRPVYRNLRGLYIHGGVGTGKSALMDLFFKAAPVPSGLKRRVHFHDFMAEVHRRSHDRKMSTEHQGGEGDAMQFVARSLAAESWLLCFDEFQVLDVADAINMYRIFDTLWQAGTVVVATSNRPPDSLYENGLNRDIIFEPFVDLLKKFNAVYDINSHVDYRYLNATEATARSASDLGHALDRSLHFSDKESMMSWAMRSRLLEEKSLSTNTGTLTRSRVGITMGRSLEVDCANAKTVVVAFASLCSTELGAADYGLLAKRFPVFIIADVPVFTPMQHDEARRMITLIDQLYEARSRLLYTSPAAPEQLFASLFDKSEDSIEKDGQAGKKECRIVDSSLTRDQWMTSEATEGSAITELRFAVRRAVSRLTEMSNSPKYQQMHREAWEG